MEFGISFIAFLGGCVVKYIENKLFCSVENCEMTKKKSTEKDSRVGIVMPAYNSGEIIEKALRSVMGQSYSDFEVFVVDDHSTDKTVEIVKKLAKEDKRIHLIQLKDDRGAAAARNLAIKRIEEDPSLKYIAFLDSDDCWRKDKLKTQIEFMKKNKVAFSYGDYDICDIVTGRIYRRRICPAKMSYFRMLIGCSVGCLTVVYDKDAVGHVEIPNLPKRNDYALWCVILKKVRHGMKYPGVLAIYDRSPGSLSSGGKAHLVKHHYRMHRDANRFNPLVASFFTATNIVNYINNIVVCEKKQSLKGENDYGQ